MFLIIISALSGIIAGMGMGGGTILIPALTILFSTSQINAQALNLISFIPCAILSLIIHFKNKLVDVNVAKKIIITALPFAIISSYVANKIPLDLLRNLFAVFIIIIGLSQFYLGIKYMFIKYKNKTSSYLNKNKNKNSSTLNQSSISRDLTKNTSNRGLTRNNASGDLNKNNVKNTSNKNNNHCDKKIKIFVYTTKGIK